MSKAARELLEQLQKAGVIKKKADPDEIRRILQSAQDNPSLGERIMGKPGGLRRDLTSTAVGGATLLGLQRLGGEKPASVSQPTTAEGKSKYTQTLSEERAFREYLDQENYNRGVLRNLQSFMHFVSGKPGEYIPSENLMPIDVDAKLREAQALRDNAMNAASLRERALKATEAGGEVAKTRETETAQTQRRALDLLQQIYGQSRQVPPAPAAADQTTQPYQY